ncbi:MULTISPECIES: Hsp70 family protein [Bacteroidaceae]|uniref:Hsp70 family protein n=1 Tax=Bacteroides acidifaciens TaxID=85831 RepID=A0A4S2ANG6_9BACE|nr:MULTISPECIES: Hsp70 family protein [Bacteroidaceae]MCR1998292.1 Hsp70 family protein [Bacteroides acidifaciens]TGY02533.1 Hsp70 family protein [Bacteroides acidifaciens]
MKHVTIDYGIDLGTTNSAICRMEHGVPVVIRSDSGMETMPSCVSFKKSGTIRIGQSAYADLGIDRLRALKKKSAQGSNSCIEFKRYMGTDMKFSNVNAGHPWSPEELSAQIVRTLCSFVTDDEVKAAVVTVPAKFTVNQKDATLEAARLAGIEQVELLQEPIAASIAYGLKAEDKNGIWMVFDLGGGTLDVALVHVSDGIMQVFDTEGDNYLGGKNMDEAIVSKIILPQITRRYALDLSDGEQYQLFVEALKVEAEKVKNKLSYCDSEVVYLEAGDWGEDGDGEEIELEITVTRQELEDAIRPILQKAVDVCKTLMLRNNISYEKLSHLILIGGPTSIPLLRKMLKEQVTENVETEINPMTAVATGAAIYASTIPVKIDENDIEDDTLQLLIDFEATTVDTQMFVPIKTMNFVEGLSVKMVRRSDGMESQNVRISEQGGLLEFDLIPNQPNTFRVVASVNGVEVKCFPAELTIVQGTKAGTAILPYNIGMEVFNPKKDKCVFTAFTGLEKNRPLPAVGTVYGLKTLSELRPGEENDMVRIAVYQGDDSAEGKTAALFEYVSDVIVSGEDIVSFIPQGSRINIKIEVARSEMMTIVVDFPESGQRVEKHLDTSRRQETKDLDYLKLQIARATSQLNKLKEFVEDMEVFERIRTQIVQIEEALDNGAQHKQIEQHLKEVFRSIEDYEQSTEWDRERIRLQRALMSLQIAAVGKKDPGVDKMVNNLVAQVERVVAFKDILKAKALLGQIEDYEYSLRQEEIYRGFIRMTDREFCSLKWKEPKIAQKLIGKAMGILKDDPEAPLFKIKEIVERINGLLILEETPYGSSTSVCIKKCRIDLPSM